MCGILAIQGLSKEDGQGLIEKAQLQAQKLTHRGPDERGSVITPEGHILCHERLSIVDLNTGVQPIAGEGDTYLIHNGEIYNHQKIRTQYCQYSFKTKSDSESILPLYLDKGVNSVHHLDGVFAFVLVQGTTIFAARDPIGVKPLFYGRDESDRLWFASEAKALQEVCTLIEEFPPGYYFHSDFGFKKYYTPGWLTGEELPSKDSSQLKDCFTQAVHKRLMSDAPLGVLLSGGLDSSLVASIISREMKKRGEKIQSFSIGLATDSKDLLAARKAADFIGSEHHEVVYTIDEGINALRDVIHKLETFDITTIRASTPMYLLSQYIAKQGVKVVLSGEGADEIFGGYLYFHEAPSPLDFHHECVRRVGLLHTCDVLRADRSTMGAAVEARVPFLDKDFLELAMNLKPELKYIQLNNGIEKNVLRQAFDDKENPYLPDEILWRQKEQFSDGVGYSWIDGLKDYAESVISDADFALAATKFPSKTPETKEAYLYRQIHSELFSHDGIIKFSRKWTPKWQTNKDPSGRANAKHADKYKKEAVIV